MRPSFETLREREELGILESLVRVAETEGRFGRVVMDDGELRLRFRDDFQHLLRDRLGQKWWDGLTGLDASHDDPSLKHERVWEGHQSGPLSNCESTCI
jgi:hypothetical protein